MTRVSCFVRQHPCQVPVSAVTKLLSGTCCFFLHLHPSVHPRAVSSFLVDRGNMFFRAPILWQGGFQNPLGWSRGMHAAVLISRRLAKQYSTTIQHSRDIGWFGLRCLSIYLWTLRIRLSLLISLVTTTETSVPFFKISSGNCCCFCKVTVIFMLLRHFQITHLWFLYVPLEGACVPAVVLTPQFENNVPGS